VSHSIRVCLLAIAVASGWALPAQAQTGASDETEAQPEIASPAQPPRATSAPASSPASEWSIKPRGRVQFDYGTIGGTTLDLPANQAQLGPDTRIRRAYLGVDVVIPGGFGARFEIDFAATPITLTDAYLFYKPTKDLTITAGHHKPFWGLEEMTSDNFTTFQERAAFTTAFGFERRIGLSAAYVGKSLVLQGGVFTDDAVSLGFPESSTVVPRDFDDAYSVDGRAVWMPKVGSGQLHVGGSIHYRDTKNIESLRYRERPFLRTTDVRFVDTGSIAGTDGELGIGAELAYIRGPFHAAAESFWQKALRPGRTSPTFNGGYAELGYVVTGEATPYKGGAYDRLTPKRPVRKGGLGAVQVNARYDWLDLNSGPIVGGRQDMAGVSLVWVPAAHLRFVADYGHFWVKDSPITAEGGQHDYEADSFGVRAQFDF
jgi:phosphate-selective porin OprO/OprP